MRITNILIASVGGQGGLTLSRVLAVAAVLDGKSVITGETLGMAQRFGSVVSYVRIGSETHSPLFNVGSADVILGLEMIEALRNLHYLREGGWVILADELKPPISSSLGIERNLGKDELINLIRTKVRELRSNAIFIPARQLAIEAGNYRAINMVILGAFNKKFGLLTDSSIRKAISQLLPGRIGEISVKAYIAGKSFMT